jgi:hypothetical protein
MRCPYFLGLKYGVKIFQSPRFHPSSAWLSYSITRIAHTTASMAIPLRKVSENYQLTIKRAQMVTIVTPYLPEALSESARVNRIGVGFPLLSADDPSCIIQARGGVTKPLAEVRNYHRSKSSFTPLPWEGIYPPGLYTAIVHNGPLRTRIQDHLDELEEFKANVRQVRRAQELLFGWLVTLYHLMLVVAWYALVRAFLTSPRQILQRP